MKAKLTCRRVKETEDGFVENGVDFTWEGPKAGVIELSALELFGHPSLTDQAPWKLRKVKDEFHRAVSLYARCYGIYFISWIWHWFWVRAKETRFVLTASLLAILKIWGLAHFEWGDKMTWKCIGRKKTKEEN